MNLFSLPMPKQLPRLEVFSLGNKYADISVLAIWNLFAEVWRNSGLLINPHPEILRQYKWLLNFVSNPINHNSYIINLKTPFMQSILKLSFEFRLHILLALIYTTHTKFLHFSLQRRRIRPLLARHFLPRFHSSTHKRSKRPSLQNLIRNRIPSSLPSLPEPIRTIIPHFRNQLRFRPLHIQPSQPLLQPPIKLNLFDLSLPRRHPREGVG